jgi:hypothetical protein
MNRPVWGILLLIGVVVAVSGCSSDSKSDPGAKADQSSSASGSSDPSGSKSVHYLSQNVAKRPSMEGRWILVFFDKMMGAEIPAALVDISKATGSSKLKTLVKGFGMALTNPHTKEASATEKSAHLLLELTLEQMSPGRNPTRTTKVLDVEVELHDGLARGNAQGDTHESFVVMMVPTDLDNIQNLRPQQLPEAVDLQTTKETTPEQFVDKLSAFVHSHPDSPLTMEVYPILFRSAVMRKIDQATLAADADKYTSMAEAWSSRVGFRSHVDVATNLVATGYMPDIALKHADIAEKNLTEERIPAYKAMLKELRDAAISTQAVTRIRTGTPEEKAKAAENLRGRLKENPYNPILISELAEYDEQQGKKQQALEGYAELCVLPMFAEIVDQMAKAESTTPTSPKQSAQALWKDLHKGKLDGFDAYLDEVYAKSMPKWSGKRVEPRGQQPDNRVVLCELFTGTDCPPCVAADIALSHLLNTYAPSEVVALEYHQHIPKPDALANNDSEQRFQFYFGDKGGTPTFGVSGKTVQAGGGLPQTNDVYKMIRAQVDLMLLRKTSVKIHLKAEPKDGVVAVTADAEGAFSANDPIKLRLVLAEDRVTFRGSNGVREHEMVVRAMPGGTGGAELKDGKLRYEGKVDVKAIRRQLDDYLRAFEEAQKTTFQSKPLDLAHLHLVAFVQNDQTKEIYQAATVPFPTDPTASPAAKSQASSEKTKAAPAAVSKASP